MLIPTFGWPQGTKVQVPPDFAWRIKVLLDQRTEFVGPTYEPDKERPAVAKPISAAPDVPPLVPNAPPREFKGDVATAYRRIAGRHASSFGIMRNGRQMMMGNNLGLIRFTLESGALHAIQELHGIFPYELDKRDPNAIEDHQPFATHKARLDGDPTENKPDLP